MIRADSFVGQVIAVISRRTPAFRPREDEPSTFPGWIFHHQSSSKQASAARSEEEGNPLLAFVSRQTGRYREARGLDEAILNRRRRVQGDDHPDTLQAATNLAIDLRALGENEAARELDKDVLARRRRVQGDDHPDTLRSVAEVLAALRGDLPTTIAVNREILTEQRAELGFDHSLTLTTADTLATLLRVW
jgi:hypothetical protein